MLLGSGKFVNHKHWWIVYLEDSGDTESDVKIKTLVMHLQFQWNVLTNEKIHYYLQHVVNTYGKDSLYTYALLEALDILKNGDDPFSLALCRKEVGYNPSF